MKTDPVVGRGVNWQMIGVYEWIFVAWISKSVLNSNNKSLIYILWGLKSYNSMPTGIPVLCGRLFGLVRFDARASRRHNS